MPRLFLAHELVERSLRKIGMFPITETAAQPEYVKEGLYWLQMRLAHICGTNRVYHLTPKDPLSLSLTGGTQSYDIEDVLGASAPDDGVQFVKEAVLDDGNGNRTPLRIVTRKEWEQLEVPGETGTPDKVYIDRLRDLTLKTHPTLASGVTGYSIKLTVVTYVPDLTKSQGKVDPTHPETWQLFIVTDLAGIIGNGPVRKLPRAEVELIKKEALDYWGDIFGRHNEEHADDHQTAFRDF